MKNLLFAFCLMFGLSAFAQQIEFKQATIDYGTISQGADGMKSFQFTNKGNAPLIIQSVSTSCGCTVADYPKEPIKPGGTGEIKVKYNTEIIGGINKKIYVNSNDPEGRTTLSIVGTVQKKS